MDIVASIPRNSKLQLLRLPGKTHLVNTEGCLSKSSNSKISNFLFLKASSGHIRILIIDDPMYFSCTLDNGLHCVTTPFKLLQKEAKIDQEFELFTPLSVSFLRVRIATDKLEFMLTLQARINLPPAPTKAKGTLGKGAFQRIFGSPKKKPATPVPPQKDPYHGLSGVIGRDGSFSRSYIALKTYENAAYGRQFTADIACLNEWALEPGAVIGRGKEMQRMRKRPYMIGKIECLLLLLNFVCLISLI